MRKNRKRTLSNSEIASFCGQVAILIQAGITPMESVRILYNDSKSLREKTLFNEILEVCKKGEPFHNALSSTEVFPEYVINMITLGEESGNLDSCMQSLSGYYEKEESITDSIKSAITYPLLMILMMMVVIFVLISKVMPIFQQVFIDLGSEMTGVSASLLHLGEQLNQYSALMITLLFLALILYFLFSKTTIGRKWFSKLCQRFPLTKNFYFNIACQRFASSMAIGLGSGMDTFSSLDIAYELVGNSIMQSKITKCKQAILSGSNFAEALHTCGIFNNLYSQMISVGTKSGNVDLILNKIAEGYEKNTDKKIQTLISVLEPTLVIILSIIVGMILLSVILPLMGIMASIG